MLPVVLFLSPPAHLFSVIQIANQLRTLPASIALLPCCPSLVLQSDSPSPPPDKPLVQPPHEESRPVHPPYPELWLLEPLFPIKPTPNP